MVKVSIFLTPSHLKLQKRQLVFSRQESEAVVLLNSLSQCWFWTISFILCSICIDRHLSLRHMKTHRVPSGYSVSVPRPSKH